MTGQKYVTVREATTLIEQTAKNDPQTVGNRSVINPATGMVAQTWKPVPLYGLEPFYQVSNTGQIQNRLTGCPVKTWHSKDGECFTLYHPVTFKFTCVQVHRAVALAFVPNPNGWHWVRRKDGNKHHNQAANLEWVASPGQRAKKALEAKQPYSDYIFDRLLKEGKLTPLERLRAGIVTAQDDSMAPQLTEGVQFIATPANMDKPRSLVGKVVVVVVKAKLFAFYLGRLVSIDEDFVRVSRDNTDWPERVESRAVIASIAKVVSVLETSIN